MFPVIICTDTNYEGDVIRAYITDASITRVRRYCAIMGYELVAYGGMVYREAETLLRGDMTLEARDWRRSVREAKSRPRKTIDEIIAESVVTFEPRDMKLWANIGRTPCPVVFQDWAIARQYGN